MSARFYLHIVCPAASEMGPQELSSPGTKGIPSFTSLKSLVTRNCLIKNDFLPRTH